MSKDDLKRFLSAVVGGAAVVALFRQESRENPGTKSQPTALIPSYKSTISRNGLVVVDFNGYQISSIYDSDFFRESLERFPGWISGPRLEIAYRSEEDVQHVLKSSGPREYSGLHPFSHIAGVVEEILRMSMKAGVPPDFVLHIATQEHEMGEDAENVTAKLRQWEDALTSGPNNSVDHQLRKSLEAKINTTRYEILQGRAQKLKSYIPSNVRGSERYHIKRDIGKAIRLVFGLTRISNEVPYAISMGHVYSRQGNEDLAQLFRRMIIKDADGVRNMRETGPSLDQTVMSLIERAFGERSPVGDELRNRYGNVRAKPVYMPTAERVRTAVNSIPALNYSNETFNRYAQEAIRNIGSRAERLFRLALLSRDERSVTAENLLISAIELYETYDEAAQASRPRVEEDIMRRLQGTYFNRLTLNDGSFKDWLLDDGGGRKYIRLLDFFRDHRLRIYAGAKHFTEVLPRFRMVFASDAQGGLVPLDQNEYDPRRHVFFTFGRDGRGGLDGIMEYMPDYWELVAQKRRDTTRMRAEVDEMDRSGQLPQFTKSVRYKS